MRTKTENLVLPLSSFLIQNFFRKRTMDLFSFLADILIFWACSESCTGVSVCVHRRSCCLYVINLIFDAFWKSFPIPSSPSTRGELLSGNIWWNNISLKTNRNNGAINKAERCEECSISRAGGSSFCRKSADRTSLAQLRLQHERGNLQLYSADMIERRK